MKQFNQLDSNPARPRIRINVPEAFVPGHLAEIQIIMETDEAILDVRSLELELGNSETYEPLTGFLRYLTLGTSVLCDTAITAAVIAGTVVLIAAAIGGNGKSRNCDADACAKSGRCLELCFRCCELCALCERAHMKTVETTIVKEYVYLPPPQGSVPGLAQPTYIEPPQYCGTNADDKSFDSKPNLSMMGPNANVPPFNPFSTTTVIAANGTASYNNYQTPQYHPIATTLEQPSIASAPPSIEQENPPIAISQDEGDYLPCCCSCLTKTSITMTAPRNAYVKLMQTAWSDWIDHAGTIQAGTYEKTFAFHVPEYATADYEIKSSLFRAVAKSTACLKIIRGDLNQNIEQEQAIKVLSLPPPMGELQNLTCQPTGRTLETPLPVSMRILQSSQLPGTSAGDTVRFQITVDNSEGPKLNLVSAKIREQSNAFKNIIKCLADGGKSVSSIVIPAHQVVTFDLGAMIPEKWRGDVDGNVFRIEHFLEFKIKGKSFCNTYKVKIPFLHNDQASFVEKVPELVRENPFQSKKQQ